MHVVKEQMSTHDVVYVRYTSITVIKQRTLTACIPLQHLPTVYEYGWDIEYQSIYTQNRFVVHDS